jgi:hypothetical protein
MGVEKFSFLGEPQLTEGRRVRIRRKWMTTKEREIQESTDTPNLRFPDISRSELSRGDLGLQCLWGTIDECPDTRRQGKRCFLLRQRRQEGLIEGFVEMRHDTIVLGRSEINEYNLERFHINNQNILRLQISMRDLVLRQEQLDVEKLAANVSGFVFCAGGLAKLDKLKKSSPWHELENKVNELISLKCVDEGNDVSVREGSEIVQDGNFAVDFLEGELVQWLVDFLQSNFLVRLNHCRLEHAPVGTFPNALTFLKNLTEGCQELWDQGVRVVAFGLIGEADGGGDGRNRTQRKIGRTPSPC